MYLITTTQCASPGCTCNTWYALGDMQSAERPPGPHPPSIIVRRPFIHHHYPIQDLGAGDIGTGPRLFDNGLEVFGDNAGLMEV